MAGKRSELIKNILSILCVLLAAAFLILIVCGNRIYVIRSGSMEPAIRTGAAAVVNSHAKYDDIRPGDVVCFAAANGTDVIHRANEIYAEGIETKGDANSVPDGAFVTEENFKGKVFFSIPYAGYVLSAVSSKKGKILILTAAGVLIVLSIMGETKNVQGRQDAQKKTN